MSKTKSKSKSKDNGSEFPVSRETFLKKAPSVIELHVNVPGADGEDGEPQVLIIPKKKFSTNSLGYFGRGSDMSIEVDGETLEGNFQFQWIAKGSKDAD